MSHTIQQTITLHAAMAGRRLDQVLVELFPEFSRARLQQWVRGGQVRLDDEIVKASHRVAGYECLCVDVALEPETRIRPEPIALRVLHEDEDVLVIDKPAGLVVHPAVGNREGTLQNALLHRCPLLASIPRAGIVHRLDKLTSGVMVVAKTLPAHKSLVDQLQSRHIQRRYLALVYGTLVSGGTMDAAIGRHPKDRLRMAVVRQGKAAVTHYRIRRRYRDFSLLAVQLETGRTHQIRVHLQHMHHPVVGDPVYGGRPRPPAGASTELLATLQRFRRQALHAWRLQFAHPRHSDVVTVEAPLPDDFANLLASLDRDDGQSG